MNNANYLFYAFILLMVILIIVSIIKKVFKLLIFVAVLIIAYSSYNIFVKGVSPIDELNGYKKDITYSKNIADYTGKIKTSTTNIKNVVASGKIDANAKKIINTENTNLHNYQKEVMALKHTDRLKVFHDKYCSFLNDIVASTDGAAKVANSSEGKNISAISGMIDKISSSIDGLANLNIDDLKK